NMTVKVGEPDSVGAFDPGFFGATGFPTCTADLGRQRVTCSGLVPSATYTLKSGFPTVTLKANANGVVRVQMPVKRDETLALSNSSNRTLTTLHVATLHVNLVGRGRTVQSGTCSPFEYWGGPLTIPPLNLAAGEPTSVAGGSALTGNVCGSHGNAAGLP